MYKLQQLWLQWKNRKSRAPEKEFENQQSQVRNKNTQFSSGIQNIKFIWKQPTFSCLNIRLQSSKADIYETPLSAICCINLK